MSTNNNLKIARGKKNDEFYTLLKDIEAELQHYDFTGKKIYCNCDDPNLSQFWNFFQSKFEEAGITSVTATCKNKGIVTTYDGQVSTRIMGHSGDFRLCEDILQTADIVVTNPPFSLYREFLLQLLKAQKQFLLVAPLNAVKYKEIFPYIVEHKLWLGVTTSIKEFKVPDDTTMNNVVERDGKKYAKFGNICWLTNLQHNFIKRKTWTQKYSPERYPTYDTYDAIEVNRVKDIPKDYKGIMGVPITILHGFPYDEFEIVGEFNHGCDNQYDLAIPKISGKELFPRIAIRRK